MLSLTAFRAALRPAALRPVARVLPRTQIVRFSSDGEEEEEPEPQDVEQIEEFLKSIGEDEYAGQFRSWDHLMSARWRELKYELEVPMKSRKNIRKQLELWKQRQTWGAEHNGEFIESNAFKP